MRAFPKNLDHPNAQFKRSSKKLVVPKGCIFYTHLKIRVAKCVDYCVYTTFVSVRFTKSARSLPAPEYLCITTI